MLRCNGFWCSCLFDVCIISIFPILLSNNQRLPTEYLNEFQNSKSQTRRPRRTKRAIRKLPRQGPRRRGAATAAAATTTTRLRARSAVVLVRPMRVERAQYPARFVTSFVISFVTSLGVHIIHLCAWASCSKFVCLHHSPNLISTTKSPYLPRVSIFRIRPFQPSLYSPGKLRQNGDAALFTSPFADCDSPRGWVER